MEKFDIKKIFGENVRYYRRKLGFSQEEFAEKIGVSPNHVSVIETGKKFVTYSLLEKIVETLNVMPATLFHTAGTASFDESMSNRITMLIQNELQSVQERIQKKLEIWE